MGERKKETMGYNTTSMMALLLVAFLLCTSSAFAFTPSTRRRQSTSVLGAARRGAGFGASALDSTIKSSSKKKKGNPNTAPTKPVLYTLDDGPSIEQYLSPRLFENDSAILKGIGEQLRNGEIVAIRDAFRPEFAEAMHEELHGCDSWSRNEDYFNDGYHFRHYNVYDKKDFSPLFVSANEVFDSADTKAFLADLSGRDCSGESVGAPSYYGPGDHSLPHTDHIGQRSVAYIWHLSNKKWKPEWGGALYWAPEPLANAFLHASFNTLVLFSVTPHSVRTVIVLLFPKRNQASACVRASQFVP